MFCPSDQTIWASVFVRDCYHEQDGRRLFHQLTVAHFHEAQLNAGFFFFGSALPRRHECARVSGCVLVIGDRTLSERSCLKRKKPRAINSGLVCLAALFAFAPSIQRIYQAIIFLQAFSDKIYLCDKFCIFIPLQFLHGRMVYLSLN